MKKLVLSILCITLTACSILPPTGSQPEEQKNTFASSGTIFERKGFSQLNICNTLIQFDLATVVTDTDTYTKEFVREGLLRNDVREKPESLCTIISKAYIEIKDGITPTKDQLNEIKEHNDLMARRNNFVSFILALSDQKCGIYKGELLRRKAELSTYLGSLATLFAGTSAVLSHPATASAFAAGSGSASGISAVYNQERFSNLSVEVITAGIDQRRKNLDKEIKGKFSLNMQEYPTGAAFQDALSYHGTCNAVTGLEVAKDSISRVENPGIKEFRKTLIEIDYDIDLKKK